MSRLGWFWVALWLALGATLADPAIAQSKLQKLSGAQAEGQLLPPPLPVTYPEDSRIPRARPDKTPFVRAAEEARAEAAAAACEAGDQAGCAELGRAFLYGEGRPQNRPVAAILLTEACAARAAEGCHWLGLLQGSVGEPALRELGDATLRRACDLGSLDACDRLADGLEGRAGVALRRAACAKGGAAACRALAEAALAGTGDARAVATWRDFIGDGRRGLARQKAMRSGLVDARLEHDVRLLDAAVDDADGGRISSGCDRRDGGCRLHALLAVVLG